MSGHLQRRFRNSLEGPEAVHHRFDSRHRRALVVVRLNVVGEARSHLRRVATIEALKVARQEIVNGGTVEQILDFSRTFGHAYLRSS
jgi:hypothetical protein